MSLLKQVGEGSLGREIPVSEEPQTVPYDPNDPINSALERIKQGQSPLAGTMPQMTVPSVGQQQTIKANQNADKANIINENAAKGEYGGNGNTIRASVQADGTLSITNVGTTPSSQIYGITGQSAEEGLTTSNIDARLSMIQNEQDPLKRVALYGQLEGDAAALKAKITGEALKSAEITMGIPELEDEVQRQRQLDRADSAYWTKYQADSDETKAAVAMLAAARNDVNQEASNALNSNITLASLNAKLVTASRLGQKLDQQDAINANKAERNAIRDEDLLAATPPASIERAKALFFQDAPGSSNTDIAKYIQTGLKDADTKEALLAPDSEIPQIAFVKGNGTAKEILTQKEMATAGITRAEAEARVNEFDSVFKDKKAREKMAQALYKDRKSPEYQAIMNEGLASQSKEAQLQYKETLFNAAMQYKQQQVTGNFVARADAWNVTDPMFQDALTKTRAAGLPTDMNNVLKQYIGTAVGAEKAAKAKAFEGLIQLGSKNVGRSELASVDSQVLIYEMQRMLLPQRKGSRVGNWIGDLSVDNIPRNFNSIPGATDALDALKATPVVQGFDYLFGEQQ